MAKDSYTELLEKVKVLFSDNRQIGKKLGKEYHYTCPSRQYYSHQWLWDSCFHAIILTHFDLEGSKKEIRTLLLSQSKDGFIPCVTLWQNIDLLEKLFYKLQVKDGITMITQPPLIPYAVETVYKKSKDKTFLNEVYPQLKLYMDWLIKNRDQNKNNLLEIIHPWEAGCDSVPSFDKQLGIKSNHPTSLKSFYSLFRVIFKYYLMGWDSKKIFKSKTFIAENLTFNSIYALSLTSMKFLSEELGYKEDTKIFEQRYLKTKSALIKHCWSENDGIFYDLDQNQKQVKAKSISSLMPLILSDLPGNMVKSLVERYLINKNEFWTDFPVPSVSRSEPSFHSGEGSNALISVLWRGPTWVNTNWFLVKALEIHGYKEQASEIADKNVEMIKESGFCEFYNPLTGKGYGRDNFSWSALVIDMF